MSDDERIALLVLENEVLQANNKGLKDTINELRSKNTALIENCITKDKIKAKIEEVNKRENVGIVDIFEDMKEYAINVLQELL